MSLRIKGLVSASEGVRQQLRLGVSATAKRALVKEITAILEQVEQLCHQNGCSPRDLPKPSYNAYRFLLTLDPDSWTEPIQADSATPPPKLSVRKLVKNVAGLNRSLWKLTNAPSSDSNTQFALLNAYTTQLKLIEKALGEAGANGGALPEPSRNAYSILLWLAKEENFQQALSALKTLAAMSEMDAQVELSMGRNLWHAKTENGVRMLKLHLGYLGAPMPILEKLGRAVFRSEDSNKKEKNELKRYPFTPRFGAFLDVTTPKSWFLGRGLHHDLGQAFIRVNQQYFAGRLQQPRLLWGPKHTQRVAGHWDFTRRLLVLSPTLDRPNVAQRIVDFVVYHELLHLVMGVSEHNGRRVVHSPAFKEAEQRFEDYEEVERELTRCLR